MSTSDCMIFILYFLPTMSHVIIFVFNFICFLKSEGSSVCTREAVHHCYLLTRQGVEYWVSCVIVCGKKSIRTFITLGMSIFLGFFYYVFSFFFFFTQTISLHQWTPDRIPALSVAFNAIISVTINKRKLFQWLLIKNHVLFHNQRYLINNVNVIEEETAYKNKQLSNVKENKRGPQVILAGNVPCSSFQKKLDLFSLFYISYKEQSGCGAVKLVTIS